MPSVLHLIDTGGPGGAEVVLSNLVFGLGKKGWRSRVLVPRYGWLSQRLEEGSVDCRILPAKGGKSWRLLFSLVRQIREFRPEVIHAHFLGSGVYGTLASSIVGGVPLLCTFHGTPDVNPGDRGLAVKARILSRSQNRIVYVSQHLRSHLEPILGVPPTLGRVVHNGVPFTDVEPGRAHPELKDLEPTVRLIGAVGNIRPAKDYPNLLRAAQAVCSRNPQVQFAIVGEGSEDSLEALCRLRGELGLDDKVRFLGLQRDVPSLLRDFEIFVSSSETEGLPLATLEAMGMGKPLVLTECGGVPEAVEHGRSGLMVPVRNPRALADGIIRLLDDPDLATRLGSEARLRARARFSLSSMLDRYVQLYEDLLRR